MLDKTVTFDGGGVQFQDAGLRIGYVPLSRATAWDDNPKAHDLPGIIRSIQKYGFQDPPRFMQALNGGRGGLVEGNGRVRALAFMQAQGLGRPRGIGVIAGPECAGEWAVPLVLGQDVADSAEAMAYALDHNNLTLTGGDFTAFFIQQIYDDSAYQAVLARLQADAVLPVTVSDEDVTALVEATLSSSGRREKAAPESVRIRLGEFKLRVSVDDFEPWMTALENACMGDRETMIAEVRRRLGLDGD